MKKVTLVITFLLFSSTAYAVPILWSGNNNHYDFIRTDITWHNAKTEAESLTYMGVSGHLVTITSASENAFINTTFNSNIANQLAWIGGFEPNDDGVWKWAVGPEAGIQFSNFDVATPPFNYANWGGIEPNNNPPGEDFTTFNIGTTFANGLISPGTWTDSLPFAFANAPIVGYLVEYETNPIPEPSTMLLLGIGLAGLAGTAVRRRFKMVRDY